jgi:hypothetical protein
MFSYRSITVSALVGLTLSACSATAPADHVGQDFIDNSGRLVAGYSSYVVGMIQEQPDGICSMLSFAASVYQGMRARGESISDAKEYVRNIGVAFRTADQVYLADTVMNKLNIHQTLSGPEAVFFIQEGCTRVVAL